MATNPLGGIYSGGAVVLNTQPLATMYQQYAAQRRAKEDALDNYYRDLGKNITPAGMRSQDISGLTQKTNEWQQYYQQNKAAILNPRLDNGKAYSQYMGRYNDQLAYINESKDALKIDDEFNKVRLDPNRSFILDDPNIIDKLHSHSLPLNDPNRVALNMSEITTPPKPWDIKDREAYSKYLTAGLNMDEISGNTQFLPGFKTVTPITKQYNDANLKVIGQRAMGAYDSDRSLQSQTNKIANQVKNDPTYQHQLNSMYQRIYGKNIETPKELLAAQSMVDENRKSIEYKQGEDIFGREKAMESIRFGHEKQLKKSDQDAANNWVINNINKRVSDARVGAPTPLWEPEAPIGIRMGYEMNIDPIMAKAFARGSGANATEPNTMFYTDNGKILPIFYKYKNVLDDKGKVIGTELAKDDNGNPKIDWDYSKPMDLDQAYLTMGYKGETKKQLSGTMTNTYKESGTNTEKHPLPAGKPKTVKQGGFTYTWNSEKGTYE